ncbi:MAG TPA: D-glycero-beta-D-manno-heptose 1-phosphate adenylyltransferase [Bacteroidota bacterium]|nr:D-glycero-beta-D-manno-heptose 1-phosphate adenylyltransferase [Bacteroidota bacterium]
MGKVLSLNALVNVRRKLRRLGRKVVFTNGTFDIIHRGHVEYLTKAKQLGEVLIVGLNTDSSIRRIKGNGRPINKNADRGAVLAALEPVDYICFFDDDTPARIIDRLVPDVLVKGADWKIGEIVGRETVEQHGGKVRTIRLTPGSSTSNVIKRVLRAYGGASLRKSHSR